LFAVKSKDNKWRPAVVNASVEDILYVCVCIYAVARICVHRVTTLKTRLNF
jgi:hypothetical protein